MRHSYSNKIDKNFTQSHQDAKISQLVEKLLKKLLNVFALGGSCKQTFRRFSRENLVEDKSTKSTRSTSINISSTTLEGGVPQGKLLDIPKIEF